MHRYQLVCCVLILPLASVRAGGLRYRVTDGQDRPIPAKLTVLPAGEKDVDGKLKKQLPKLAIKTQLPYWAARDGVVYTLPGDELIPLPAGSYRVIASHGFEWTIAEARVEVPQDGEARFEARLERVVDTRGYLSADLHLHTLTHSGHGDTNVEERIITLCAEEVEWAVATDHNHVTDYVPHVKKLGAERWILTTPGNEVTTTLIGHFNAFPLDPARPVTDWKVTDARELFRRLRAEGAEVIQVNHPRWTGARGAYFRDLEVSPVTGDSYHPEMTYSFDAFEVVNGNDLSGWVFQPEFGTGKDPALDSSVRDDWYNFLNRGLVFTAVGNSDSHHVNTVIGGCPRNYIRASTDDPARADPRELMAAVRSGALTVSSGIFVEASADGELPGSMIKLVPSRQGEFELKIRVQAAPWIGADRLILVANGEEVHVQKLGAAAAGSAVRYEGVLRHRPARDTWYVVIAIGDEAPVPIQHETLFPLGFTNAFRVDADGDGVFTPLRDHARRLMEAALPVGALPASLAEESASFRRQAVGAVGELAARGANGEQVVRLLTELARDKEARVRAGARELLSRRPERSALLGLLSARAVLTDGFERARTDFELVRAGHVAALLDWKPAYDRAKGIDRLAQRRDLLELVRTRPLRGWATSGPYPARTWQEGLEAVWPPEASAVPSGDAAAVEPTRWRSTSTDKRCQLNFRDTMDPRVFAVAYARIELDVTEPLATALLIESQNALRVFVQGVEVYRQEPRTDAETRLEIVPISLARGSQAVLVKSAVERGSWGFVLHLVDPLRRVVVD